MAAEPVEPVPAPTKPKTFGSYRRKPVRAVTGRFKDLGDGLSKSMEIEGEPHEPGTWITHVVRSRVGPHKMILEDDGKGFVLEETYLGRTVIVIDDDLVAAPLNAMEFRIKEREDAAKGAPTLAGVDEAAKQPGAGRFKALEAVEGGKSGKAEGKGGTKAPPQAK